MKVIFKRVCLGLLILLIALTVYAAAVSLPAKKHTKELFGRILSSEIMELKVSDFSQVQMYQLLKVEDPDFYNHRGVDFSTPGAGMTTITQALVKQYYFKKFKPGWAKLKQTFIALLAVNPLISKDQQMQVFVNTVYMGEHQGEPVYGFSQAARSYFEKEFSDLSKEQYLALLAMIIAPNKMHVLKHPQSNQIRVQRIQRYLTSEYQPQGLRDVWYDK